MARNANKIEDLECEVSLSRGTGPHGSRWRLRVTDNTSRETVVELDLTDEQLGSLLGCTPIWVSNATAYDSGRLGKRMVTETCTMPLPENANVFAEWETIQNSWAAQLAQHGWEMDRDESYNYHKRDADSEVYKVTIRKWVDLG